MGYSKNSPPHGLWKLQAFSPSVCAGGLEVEAPAPRPVAPLCKSGLFEPRRSRRRGASTGPSGGGLARVACSPSSATFSWVCRVRRFWRGEAGGRLGPKASAAAPAGWGPEGRGPKAAAGRRKGGGSQHPTLRGCGGPARARHGVSPPFPDGPSERVRARPRAASWRRACVPYRPRSPARAATRRVAAWRSRVAAAAASAPPACQRQPPTHPRAPPRPRDADLPGRPRPAARALCRRGRPRVDRHRPPPSAAPTSLPPSSLSPVVPLAVSSRAVHLDVPRLGRRPPHRAP